MVSIFKFLMCMVQNVKFTDRNIFDLISRLWDFKQTIPSEIYYMKLDYNQFLVLTSELGTIVKFDSSYLSQLNFLIDQKVDIIEAITQV